MKKIFHITHAPRPFEKWLSSLFDTKEWNDVDEDITWLKRLRNIASETGCRIIFDIDRHWRESKYVVDYNGKGATILAGGAGNRKYCCTAILHEFGHHILRRRYHHPKDFLKGEEAAWKIAAELATLHQLPFISDIRRKALYSYRLGILQLETIGSKRKRKIRPLSKTWQLVLSKRTTEISGGKQIIPFGKKGRRHYKKSLKKATSKAERRKPIIED